MDISNVDMDISNNYELMIMALEYNRVKMCAFMGITLPPAPAGKKNTKRERPGTSVP